MIGLCGILFARQLQHPVEQLAVVIVSVAAPVFAGGYLFARVHGNVQRRLVLMAGVVLLIGGAMVTIALLTGGMSLHPEDLPYIERTSRWVGLTSLILGLLAVLVAIIGREEEFGEITQRFSQLADQMGEGVILVAADGTVTLANRQLLEMTGLNAAEIVGHDSEELAKRLGLDAMLPHTARRKQGISSEYRLTWNRQGEDRRFLVTGSPIFDRLGRYSGTLTTLRDTTDEQRLSERLERHSQEMEQLIRERTQQLYVSEGRFHDLLMHMNEGFLTLDAAYRVRFANKTICGLLHVVSDDVVGRPLFDFVEPTGEVKLLQLFDFAHSEKGTRVHHEVAMKRPDGSSVPVLVAAAPIGGTADDEPRFSLVITDLREQKRMQHQLEVRARELEEANEELRMLDRAKDSLVTNISHELRTPLSTIRGYVELLGGGELGPLEERQEDAVTVMSRNVNRLGYLIEEMLEFMRMETRGISLVMTLLPIHQIVEEGITSASPHAKASGIALSCDIISGMPFVWGDHQRIAQVLAILLSNAIKFTNAGGQVRVRAAVRPDGSATLAVEDTGIGIDPSLTKDVFDRFYQVDGSLSRRYEGAGIGLSIAKTIVDAHHGEIELESVPGKGSTFTVVLPAATFDDSFAEDHALSLRGKKILLVSDEPAFTGALENLFTSIDCDIRIAESGYQATRLAAETLPDLVLVDEILVDITGVATVVRMGENTLTRDLPVILFAGSGNAPGFDMVALQGVKHVLPKPFTADKLLADVRGVCLGERIADGDGPASLEPEQEPRPEVLVVDADADILEWLETALGRRRIHCSCAADMDHAVQLAQQSTPDFVFLEADAIGNGDSVISAVHDLKSGQDVPVYLLAGLPGEHRKLPGVSGVLHKPFSVQQIMDIIQPP